ncbi:hypothetical protein WJX81_004371 [Elliptochloris bilobata]|uniref:Uncharacterized protein n=1 Tax=Elliptochloris bilobata TaxID=381761 RepID=A0AAW1RS71_9CHLO
MAANTEQECNCCGCIGFETRKVTRHHMATAATGTAATMPGSQPAQGHHTGVGAAISSMMHPHGTATNAQAQPVGTTTAPAPQYAQQTMTGAGYPAIGQPTKTVS